MRPPLQYIAIIVIVSSVKLMHAKCLLQDALTRANIRHILLQRFSLGYTKESF